MRDDLVTPVLSALCVFIGTICIVCGSFCIEYRHELKLARQSIADKEQVIDEQNSIILKLLDHIKQLRGDM